MRRALPVLGLLLVACGGAPQAARQANAAIALAVAELDAQAAVAYTRAAELARAESDTWEEYDLAMRPHNDLELALRISASGVFAVDASFDTWDATSGQSYISAGGCLVVALRELLAAAEALGLQVPPELRPAIVQVGALAGGVCERGGL